MFPEEADIEAVGVPLLTFMNANLEDAVEVPPMRRSSVEASLGNIVPFATFQLVPPVPVQLPKAGVPAPFEIKHSPLLPAPVWERTPVVFP